MRREKFCRRCGRDVPAFEEAPNHILHALLTLFLCGAWLPVWLMVSLGPGAWKCSVCGARLGGTGVAIAAAVLIVLVVVLCGIYRWH